MSTFFVVLFLQILALIPIVCVVLTGGGAVALPVIAGIRFFVASDDKMEKFCIAGILVMTVAFIGSLAVIFSVEAGTYSGELFVKLMNAAANM